jgi:hypothetical protein
MSDIDNVLNSDEEDCLDINADTETMNKQINDNISKKKSTNSATSATSTASDTKTIKIDKNVLKTLIIEWLALDDQIKTYKEYIKDKSDEKKQYEEQILELMKVLDQEIILTDKGNITRNVRESKSPLTPELIKTTLTDLLKCSNTADTYTNNIMDKRTKKETVSLKRKEINEKKKKVKNNK